MSEVALARSLAPFLRADGRRDGGTPAETTMMKANSDDERATDGKNLAEDSHHFSRYRLSPDMEADAFKRFSKRNRRDYASDSEGENSDIASV